MFAMVVGAFRAFFVVLLLAVPVLSQTSVTQNSDKPQVLDANSIANYCSKLANNVEHASALERACQFALAMPRKLPDIICDQQTKRSWSVSDSDSDSGFPTDVPQQEEQSDIVTAKLTYRDGHEHYDNVRVNGKLVRDAAPWTQGGAWSIGEFASILSGIFASSSHAEFRFLKEEKLRSIPMLVFAYRVRGVNNKTYFIDSGSSTWFPEYNGKIWLEKQSLELRRLERETAYMRDHAVRQIKSRVDYNNISLGDGTKLILPTNSEVQICLSPKQGSVDNCSQNAIRFENWHKFAAKATIVTTSPN